MVADKIGVDVMRRHTFKVVNQLNLYKDTTLLCYLTRFFHSPFPELRLNGLSVISKMLNYPTLTENESFNLIESMYSITTNDLIPPMKSLHEHIKDLEMEIYKSVQILPRDVALIIASYTPIASNLDYKYISEMLSHLIQEPVLQPLLIPRASHWIEIVIKTMLMPEDYIALEGAEVCEAICAHTFPQSVVISRLDRIVDILLTNMEKKEDDEKKEIKYDQKEEEETWNKRKASASALDAMAVYFKTNIFDVVIPIIKVCLFFF